MNRDRLNRIGFLCTALVLSLTLWPPSNLFSLDLWPILALLGILTMFGSGFAILLWPSRYGEDDLSGLQLVLIFAGSILALLGTFVQIIYQIL
jgi:hypothetical protein